VYILGVRTGRLYTGYTVDLNARLKKHVEGKGAKFTRAFPPSGLLRAWKIRGKKGDAMRIELLVKRQTRLHKLDLIARPGSLLTLAKKIGIGSRITAVRKPARLRPTPHSN